MAMAASTLSFLLMIIGFLCSSHAHNYTFYVGGNDGWTLMPSESYSHWAQRYRFRINDQLVFKYKKGHDSVVVVTENDYYKCNKDKPLKVFKDGESRFMFDRSGPFFFISGHGHNCEKDQKLIIVVLSNHHHNATHNQPETPLPPPSSSPSPSPTAMPVPKVKPPAHSPSPTPARAPPVKPPSGSQSPSPAETITPTRAPTAQTPSHSPSPSPAPSDHYALPPRPHSPAPAPSSASGFGDSFALIVGLSVVATMISARLI